MGREAVEEEMREVAGTVLAVLDRVPDELVDGEWQLLRRALFDETLIPSRYKALIGLAVAAVLRCPNGIRLHTEMARVHGASEAELTESVHHATFAAGWSIRTTGLQVDPADLIAEIAEVVGHVATRTGVEW